MRIIIDIRPLLEPRRSGVGTFTAEATRALAARGAHEYALFANGRNATVPGDVPSPSSLVTHRFSRYPNRILNASFAFLRRPRIESLAGPADAVWLPNLNFVATALPTAVTVHDLSFARYPQFFTAKQRLWHRMINPRAALRRASAVVAVSAHTRMDVIETYGVPADKVTVAHPGINATFVPQEDAAVRRVRERHGLHRPFFLFLGVIEPRKNVAGLIAAFSRVTADADLVIAGGKGWLCDDVFRAAARSPKKDRIRFLGYVDETEKPALYAAASAFVYPSFYEGFGIPPLEAMAVGTPVIASQTSSLGEVVGDAGLLVDPRSPAEIADAMNAVFGDGRLADELRRRGRERARRFTWEKTAESLEAAFASLSTVRT